MGTTDRDRNWTIAESSFQTVSAAYIRTVFRILYASSEEGEEGGGRKEGRRRRRRRRRRKEREEEEVT